MGQAAGPDKLSDAACRGRTDASSRSYGMIISRLFDFVNSGFFGVNSRFLRASALSGTDTYIPCGNNRRGVSVLFLRSAEAAFRLFKEC